MFRSEPKWYRVLYDLGKGSYLVYDALWAETFPDELVVCEPGEDLEVGQWYPLSRVGEPWEIQKIGWLPDEVAMAIHEYYPCTPADPLPTLTPHASTKDYMVFLDQYGVLHRYPWDYLRVP